MFVPTKVQKRLENAGKTNKSQNGSANQPILRASIPPLMADAKNAPIYDDLYGSDTEIAKAEKEAQPPRTTNELNEWLLPLGILPETVEALKRDEWSSKLEVLAMENDDVQSLPITKGQRRLLGKIVRENAPQSASITPTKSEPAEPTSPLRNDADSEIAEENVEASQSQTKLVIVTDDEEEKKEDIGESRSHLDDTPNQDREFGVGWMLDDLADRVKTIDELDPSEPNEIGGKDSPAGDEEDIVVPARTEEDSDGKAREEEKDDENVQNGGSTAGVGNDSDEKVTEEPANGNVEIQKKHEDYIEFTKDDLNIFVGRLELSTSPDSLKSYFSQFGEVASTFVPQPNKGKVFRCISMKSAT